MVRFSQYTHMLVKYLMYVLYCFSNLPDTVVYFPYHYFDKDADDDDDTGTLIVQLLQKDKRKIRHQMHQTQDIGFFIYKHLEGYPFPLPKVSHEEGHNGTERKYRSASVGLRTPTSYANPSSPHQTRS